MFFGPPLFGPVSECCQKSQNVSNTHAKSEPISERLAKKREWACESFVTVQSKTYTFNIGRQVHEIACWKAGGLTSVSFMFIRNLWFQITISKLKLQAGNRTQGMFVIRARWDIAHGISFDNSHRARHVMCRNVPFSQILLLRHQTNENTRYDQCQRSNYVAVDKGTVCPRHGYSPAGAQVSRAGHVMSFCASNTTEFATLMDRVRGSTCCRRICNRSSRSTYSPSRTGPGRLTHPEQDSNYTEQR